MTIDARVGPLIFAALLMIIVNSYSNWGVKLANQKPLEQQDLVKLILVFAASLPFFYGAAALADQILWNMVAPVFGLPQIDFWTALALGWLTFSLFSGQTPRRVRIVKPDVPS